MQTSLPGSIYGVHDQEPILRYVTSNISGLIGQGLQELSQANFLCEWTQHNAKKGTQDRETAQVVRRSSESSIYILNMVIIREIRVI